MKKKIITIIDYGMGNLISIENAIKYLNHECIITSDNKKLKKQYTNFTVYHFIR